MTSTWRLLTWPFRALGRLVKLIVIPAALGVLTWWLWTWFDSGWFLGVTVLCGIWAAVVVYLWWLQLTGKLTSLERGEVRVSESIRGRR
ncbi:MAG: hypothetical protein ACRDMV_18250 [Streptosporangiales bacterium]